MISPRFEAELDRGVQRCAHTDDGSQFQFENAFTPYLGDAVLAHIRGMSQGLGELPLNREIWVTNPQLAGVPLHFRVGPDGKISPPAPDNIDARIMWANLRPNKKLGGTLDDGEVYAGMYALLANLKAIPAARISDTR